MIFKIKQLNSDMLCCRCKNLSVKQVIKPSNGSADTGTVRTAGSGCNLPGAKL